jgi:hypothetical protein
MLMHIFCFLPFSSFSVYFPASSLPYLIFHNFPLCLFHYFTVSLSVCKRAEYCKLFLIFHALFAYRPPSTIFFQILIVAFVKFSF